MVWECDWRRVAEYIRRAETEELLDRVTVYRAGMEPAAVDLMEHELDRRGISREAIAEHAAERRILFDQPLFEAGDLKLQLGDLRFVDHRRGGRSGSLRGRTANRHEQPPAPGIAALHDDAVLPIPLCTAPPRQRDAAAAGFKPQPAIDRAKRPADLAHRGSGEGRDLPVYRIEIGKSARSGGENKHGRGHRG